jgi:hypothetical protein
MICGRPVVQIGRPQPVVISADLMKHLWGRKNSLAGVEHACCCRDRSAAHFQLSSTSGTHAKQLIESIPPCMLCFYQAPDEQKGGGSILHSESDPSSRT